MKTSSPESDGKYLEGWVFFFFNVLFIFERETQSARSGGGREEGHTESTAGSRL